jgi:phosphoenolpyruvate---glycerone phosphotransferase subunit DhaL
VDYLTELDSQLGDGDHGANMDRGFTEASKRVSEFQGKDVGSLLELVGSTLLSSIGGASGPIFGTAFRKAGRACKGKTEIRISELVEMFEAAETGVANLGGAKLGDKTMLDSLHPANEAAKKAYRDGETDLVRVMEFVTTAAESGLEETKHLAAKKGRASYLGERSIGMYDVGAASFCLILKSSLETLRRLDTTHS